jgi:dihydroxyacetone kinase
MKTSVAIAVAVCAAGMAAAAANAADAPPAPARAAAADAASAPARNGAETSPATSTTTIVEIEVGRAGEPNVKRTIIDDGRARIEELRVRGQLQKVTVAPKGNVPGYEILLGDGTHTMGDDPGTSRGSLGKRVWNVFRF